MQAFLRFAVFYKQFITESSQMTKPLTEMTKNSYVITRSCKNKVKYKPFQWIENYEKICQDLKQVFMTVSVLTHYNLKLKT